MNIFTYQTIDELSKDLDIQRQTVYPDFFLFNFNELGDVDIRAKDPHKKSFFEINFHFRNELSNYTVGHVKVKQLSGSILFNAPMQLFAVAYPPSCFAHGYSIMFEAEFLRAGEHQYDIQQQFPFLKQDVYPTCQLSPAQQSYLMDLLETMHLEYTQHSAYSREILQGYFYALLHYIKRITDGQSASIELLRYQEITGQFEQLIVEDEVFQSIEYYADKLHITPVYLSECTKKTTNQSAKQLLMSYRLYQAKSLLVQTNRTIDEISFELGFTEATNFGKFFKRQTGHTPAGFRKLPRK